MDVMTPRKTTSPSWNPDVRRGLIPHDIEARLQRGESLRVLFDANILLDVFRQREGAVPAARALTFAELDAVRGFVCASAFGVICHHGATRGPGRIKRERLLAAETMRLLQVLPLTEDELTAALRYDHLSFEDAQVAAAGDLASGDAILTNDAGFIKGHERACRPQDLIPALEEHLGEKCICRVIQVTEQGTFRVEISNPAGGWRQTLPLTGFPTQEEAERVAGLWRGE